MLSRKTFLKTNVPIFGYTQSEYTKLVGKYTKLQEEKTMIEKELKHLEEQMTRFK